MAESGAVHFLLITNLFMYLSLWALRTYRQVCTKTFSHMHLWVRGETDKTGEGGGDNLTAGQMIVSLLFSSSHVSGLYPLLFTDCRRGKVHHHVHSCSSDTTRPVDGSPGASNKTARHLGPVSRRPTTVK